MDELRCFLVAHRDGHCFDFYYVRKGVSDRERMVVDSQMMCILLQLREYEKMCNSYSEWLL